MRHRGHQSASGLRAASASGLIIGIILIIISMFGAMGILIDCMHRSYAYHDYQYHWSASGLRAASASGLIIGIILIIIIMFGAMGMLIDCMHRSYAYHYYQYHCSYGYQSHYHYW